MAGAKTTKNANNESVHYSVGAIIKRDGKYLLIDRAKEPFGFAGIAGHVDEGEDPITSLKREVEEESSLLVKDFKLLIEEEVDWNLCRRGVKIHHWYLYECEVEGNIKLNAEEAKSINWYKTNELNNLNLEPIWKYWFEKLKVI